MFATFCVYFVYDFYTNNNNNNKSWGQKGGVVLASQHGPSEAPKVKTIWEHKYGIIWDPRMRLND